MRSVRDLTINQKLLLITMAPLAASLLVAGIGIVVSDSILFRNIMERDLSALAAIVGDNSTAALAFNDPRVATETLTALRARPHLVNACIYKPDGTIFAQYSQPGATPRCYPPSEGEKVRFTLLGAVASQPILLSGRRIGTLVIFYDVAEAEERTRLYVSVVLAILLGSSLIAFLFSSRLRRLIATPISRLALAASSVSRTGDYGVRVEKYSSDELGVLVDSFNQMLDRVQSRDIEVQNARYSLETTLTSIADAVISTDTSARIVFVNPVAQTLLRLKESDILGKHIDQVFRSIDEFSRQSMEVPIHRVLRNRAVVGPAEHTVLIAADGTEFPIDESAAPIRDARGETTGVVLVFRDVSSRRATEKLLEEQAAELRERAQLLKEADERKNEFLAMLAHELRNPLAPIRNAAQVLLRAGSADDKHRWVGEVVERQTQYLARLVDDLLDVSRITRGKVILQQEILDLTTIIMRAVETSRPMIDARKHQLVVTLPDKPIRLRGDLTRLVQVVGNLLNNAAKFMNDGGRILLKAEQVEEEIIIRVTDNGVGLTAELMPHVFELFTQADKTLDRSQGGLGVGLTIASSLIELHGGKIGARSEGPGKGSEFTVRLPALAPALAVDAPDEPVAVPHSGNGSSANGRLRVLVLEDNPDSAEMLRLMLELDGYHVQTAADGTVGLETADTFKPNVVLCDIGLPGMSGYEVAMKLRSDPGFNSTRLIALSGYGREEDRRRSREAGFDFHLAKPVEPHVLLTLLRTI